MTLRLHISDHNDDLHNTTAKRNTAGGVIGLEANSLIDIDYLPVHQLTVTEFQTNAGTGTSDWPDKLNDNAVGADTLYDVIGEYVQVDFDDYAFITEYRYYGHWPNDGTGRLKIQHLWGTTWVDNTIDIPTKNASWSNWIPLTIPIFTKGIRLIATTLQTVTGTNRIGEMEIRG